MSRLEPSRNDPASWARFAQSHAVGDVVDGTVTTVTSFGAFVAVGEGIEGLVHVSDMAVVLAVGDSVRVTIAATDEVSRRMNLVPA